MQDTDNVQILLLGCGYTLERVATRLPPTSVLATVQSETSARNLNKLGILSKICRLDDKATLAQIFKEHPNIRILVDSVPPLAAADAKDRTAGVRNVIASLENTKLERIIYLSTSGVFGVSDGSWVDESCPTNPDNPKSQARLDCENLYRKSGIPSISLRIVGIYGPGRGLGIAMKQGRIPELGSPTRWTNRIHVEDLAAVIQHLILVPITHELPEIICACDDEPAQVQLVLEHYRRLLDLKESNIDTKPADKSQSRNSLNQRISNRLMKSISCLSLKYPSFREGAGSEFSNNSELV